MKVAYIAGPYRAKTINGIVINIRKAEAVAIKYWLKGYAVICPHKNTALFDGTAPDKVWLKGDLEFIKRLIPGKDVLVMMSDWKSSSGAVNECNFALSLGIEIIYDDGKELNTGF